MDYQARTLLDDLLSSGKIKQEDVERIKIEAVSKGVDVVSYLLQKKL